MFAPFFKAKQCFYPDFTEKAVMHLVVQMDKDGATMATLSQIKPALSLVEKLTGKQGSSFTDMVDILLNAAKRRAAELKPVVQKV